MGIDGLKKTIEELQKIIEGWHDGERPASIEIDMAVERVKNIYETLRFSTFESEEEVEVEESEVGEVEFVEEQIEEEIEEVEQEAIEEAKQIKQERQRKILSLYEDGFESFEESSNECDEVIEPEPEPEPQPEIEIEPEIVVEKVVVEPTQTIHNADPISSQLGINDRLLLASDLFDGDIAALNDFIEVMELQPSLDDAILYIAEHYSWSGDQDGAKLLYILLENRFS